MKIYKYEMPTRRGTFTRQMHRIDYTMHVAVVNDIPYLWASVNDEEEFWHTIMVCYTGEPVPDLDQWVIIGTVVLDGGAFVLHYYRLIE